METPLNKFYRSSKAKEQKTLSPILITPKAEIKSNRVLLLE